MTFDDVLLALFHANVGSRALDAVVYEHVFGYPVRRQTGNPNAPPWSFREGRRWEPMGQVTTDINDAIRFASTRVDPIGPLISEAASMIGHRRNSAFMRSLPLAVTFCMVRAKVGVGSNEGRLLADVFCRRDDCSD